MCRSMHGHEMAHPRRVLVEGAGPARTQDRVPLANDLGLNKEIAERRMQRVCGRRCEHDFRVTRDLDRPADPRAVGDAGSTQFDVIFRRHHDFGMRLDILVAAAKLSPSLRKDDFVVLRLLERRLIGRRPELPARPRRGCNRTCPSCRRYCLRASV